MGDVEGKEDGKLAGKRNRNCLVIDCGRKQKQNGLFLHLSDRSRGAVVIEPARRVRNRGRRERKSERRAGRTGDEDTRRFAGDAPGQELSLLLEQALADAAQLGGGGGRQRHRFRFACGGRSSRTDRSPSSTPTFPAGGTRQKKRATAAPPRLPPIFDAVPSSAVCFAVNLERPRRGGRRRSSPSKKTASAAHVAVDRRSKRPFFCVATPSSTSLAA